MVEDLTDDFIILSYRYAAQVELPLLDVVSRGPNSHAPGPSSRCGCYYDDPHNTGFLRAMPGRTLRAVVARINLNIERRAMPRRTLREVVARIKLNIE